MSDFGRRDPRDNCQDDPEWAKTQTLMRNAVCCDRHQREDLKLWQGARKPYDEAPKKRESDDTIRKQKCANARMKLAAHLEAKSLCRPLASAQQKVLREAKDSVVTTTLKGIIRIDPKATEAPKDTLKEAVEPS